MQIPFEAGRSNGKRPPSGVLRHFGSALMDLR